MTTHHHIEYAGKDPNHSGTEILCTCGARFYVNKGCSVVDMMAPHIAQNSEPNVDHAATTINLPFTLTVDEAELAKKIVLAIARAKVSRGER